MTRNPYDLGSWQNGHGVCSAQMSTLSTANSSPYRALKPALSASADARWPPPVSDMRIITRFCVFPVAELKRARKGAPRAVGREKALAAPALESCCFFKGEREGGILIERLRGREREREQREADEKAAE